MKSRILVITSSMSFLAVTTLGGILIAKTYDKLTVGTYRQGVLLFSMVSVIASFGLPKAIFFFGNKGENPQNYIRHIGRILILANIIISGIFAIFWKTICDQFSNPLLFVFLLPVLINLFLRTVNQLFQALLITAEEVPLIWKTNIASSFILLVSISAVCYYGMPIVYILYANAAIELLKSLIMLIVYFRFTSKTPFAPDFQKYIEILKYCTPLILSTITLLFAKRIDGLIVSKMMDPKSYAVFSYGALELPLGPLIVMNIAALTMPVLVRFYSNNRFGDITEILLKEIRRITLILFPLFFGFLLIYQEFIVFLYSEEYIGSVPVFFVYLFLLPLQLYAFNTVIQAMNMTSANLFITNVALATNVTVSLILIKPLGIVGPAIGTIIAIFIEKFMTLRIIHKKLGNSIKKWLPWKYLMQLTLSCAIPFTILLLLVKPSLPETHLTKILTLFGIYMVITPLILWYANLLEKEDKETLLVYIRKIPVLKRIFVG